MEINDDQANALCEAVVERLLNWPALMASLQSGRGEINKVGVIESVMTDWANCLSDKDLVVLMEHKDIDYALIDKNSVGQAQLCVKGVIEFKFNYVGQERDIRDRLEGKPGKRKKNRVWISSAMQQACQYAKEANDSLNTAHVLYLIAEPKMDCPFAGPLDPGWKYWKPRQLEAAVQQIETFLKQEKIHAKLIGAYSSNSDHVNLHCCLIAASVEKYSDLNSSELESVT